MDFFNELLGTSLTTTVNGNGSIQRDPAKPLYPYGSTVRLTGLPASGAYFGAWGNAAVSVANPVDFVITNPAPTVSILFLGLPSEDAGLTVTPRGHGTVRVQPRAQHYSLGAQVTLTAQPDAGEEFLGWSGDASGTQNPLTVTLTASRTIGAEFTRKPELAIDEGGALGKGGVVQLQVLGELGGRYTIERSSDLQTWTPRGTVDNLLGTAQFSEPVESGGGAWFYRATPTP